MKFAAKRLRRSDLTLFEVQLRRQNAGNQKAINLNRAVFVDLIFPGAPTLSAGLAKQFKVLLRIFGPNAIREAQQVTRKVIAAGGRQKNWRLNGETIRDPDEGSHPRRYDDLQEGDLALFGFEGADAPDSIDLVLVSQHAAADAGAFDELQRILGTRRMAALSADQLTALAAAAGPGHPIAELVDPTADEELEEAALGSSEAIRSLRKRSIRRQSAEDLGTVTLY